MNNSIFFTNKSSKLFTLIVVINESKILLGFKKRGFGVGKWNGFGGKVEPGESIVNAAVRELEEECGLIAKSLTKHGIVWFDNEENVDTIDEVHIFTTTKYEGEIIESDEMIPKWFNKNEIPYHCMWQSNSHWLPLTVDCKKFDAIFFYKNENEMVNFKIKIYGHV